MAREHSGRVLAALVGRIRDFQLAEESLQDAWLAAAESWPVDGWPDNPPGWIYTVAHRRALDTIRRERSRRDRQATAHDEWHRRELDELDHRADRWHSGIDDDRLRLIFTCCHPVLEVEAQVALTLRSVAWLTTEEIADGFGVPSATMAQRVVRAKQRIKQEGVPYEVPVGHELPDRLVGVLRVVYLVFNEAYLSKRPANPLRRDLADEAVRLGRLLVELMPDEPEAVGLTALMLVQHARSPARIDPNGDLILLPDQDRSLWDATMVEEASQLLERAMRRRRVGPYQLQAAIAALHSQAPDFEQTDWAQIAALYDVLMQIAGGPVVAMNRAVAIGFAQSPAAGLAALDLVDDHRIPQPHLLHAARGELLLAAERPGEARVAFDRALGCEPSPSERRHLERRRAASVV